MERKSRGSEKAQAPVDRGRRAFLKVATAGTAGALFWGKTAPLRADQGPSLSSLKWREKFIVPKPSQDDQISYREFQIDVQTTLHEILPGVKLHLLAFNGQVPGPEIRVKEGEWVKVKFTNKTELLHTIHWHGVDVYYEHDGVPWITQRPVMPGKSFLYKFQAYPAGTRWYHCHYATPFHLGHSMHGAIIIESDDDPILKTFQYSRDYTLVLQTFDTFFLKDEFNKMLERMKQRLWLMKHKKLDAKTIAVFKNVQEFLKAVEEGWMPPYLSERNQFREGADLTPNFFAINGKAYPLTDPILIRQGETIRVRLINAGELIHSLHLHGHQFWWVAQDGNPLLQPIKMNTLDIAPGQTKDIIIEGYNPGYWTFHDHITTRVTNNGIYPGGMLTLLVYEEMAEREGFKPMVSLDQ